MTYATDKKLVLQDKPGSHPSAVILSIEEYRHARTIVDKTMLYQFVVTRYPDKDSVPLIIRLGSEKSVQFPTASVTGMTPRGNAELESVTLAELAWVLLLDRFVVSTPENTL